MCALCDEQIERNETRRSRTGRISRILPPRKKEICMGLIILIVILLLVFGGGGGYYGYNRWGYAGGGGIGVGTILLILVVCWLLGVFH
jgi:hypothetical protein